MKNIVEDFESCCTEAVKEFIAVAQFFFVNVLVDLAWSSHSSKWSLVNCLLVCNSLHAVK